VKKGVVVPRMSEISPISGDNFDHTIYSNSSPSSSYHGKTTVAISIPYSPGESFSPTFKVQSNPLLQTNLEMYANHNNPSVVLNNAVYNPHMKMGNNQFQ